MLVNVTRCFLLWTASTVIIRSRCPPSDAEKIAFQTPMGKLRHRVMPFGLKSAGPTYQRAMTIIFHDKLDDLLEDYVDDIVVKFREACHHIDDLRRIFTRCM